LIHSTKSPIGPILYFLVSEIVQAGALISKSIFTNNNYAAGFGSVPGGNSGFEGWGFGFEGIALNSYPKFI